MRSQRYKKLIIFSLGLMAISGLSGCATMNDMFGMSSNSDTPVKPVQVEKVKIKTSEYLIYRPISISNDTTQVGRYQTVVNQAQLAQENPLFAVAQFQFSRQVKTIGEAVDQVLLNTGYRIVAEDKLPPAVATILKQPLPLSQRKLGPIRIVDALNLLVGKQVYSLLIDPVHRLVTFKLNDDYAHFSDAGVSQDKNKKTD